MKFNEFKVGMILHDSMYKQYGLVVETTPKNIKMFVSNIKLSSNVREVSINVNISLRDWEEDNSWASATVIKHPKMIMRKFVREVFEDKIS